MDDVRNLTLADAEKANKEDSSSEATMVLRRMKVYEFVRKISKPDGQIPQCACCFASFLFEGEAAFQSM